MAIIAKTLTRGFRTCFFRNQSVHNFYGHLQAVLREIAPTGEMDHLFARPVNAANAMSNGEMEWETDLPGTPVKFADLPAHRQEQVAATLGSFMTRIKSYAETRQTMSGKEKDYSNYLKAVAVSPDLDRVFLVNDKPVMVHWGFLGGDGSSGGQAVYAGWDEFIAEISRKKTTAPSKNTPEPEAAPIVLPPEPFFANDPRPDKPQEKTAAPAKEAVTKEVTEKQVTRAVPVGKKADKNEDRKEKKLVPAPDKPKAIMDCGLGTCEWVKWLAILLAIIILLLLLLRLLPPDPSRFPQMPPGMMSGGGISGGAGGGGLPGGNGGGNGSGGGAPQPPAPGKPCPTCGHIHDPAPAVTPVGEKAAGQKQEIPDSSRTPINEASTEPAISDKQPVQPTNATASAASVIEAEKTNATEPQQNTDADRH